MHDFKHFSCLLTGTKLLLYTSFTVKRVNPSPKINEKITGLYTEKNSSVKFIELYKSWEYRHSRNRVLEN